MFDLITEGHKAEYAKLMYMDSEKYKKDKLVFGVIGAVIGIMIGVFLLVIVPNRVVSISIGIVATILGSLLGSKIPYSNLKKSVIRQNNRVGLMFPEFLQIFLAMIEVNPNNSILQILQQTIPYLKDPIKGQVMKLTYRINSNADPLYVRRALEDFGKYIGTNDAMRVLDMIYMMYNDGVNTKLLEDLAEKVEALNENKVNAYVESKKKRLQGKAFPALVLGIVFIFGFVGIVGAHYLYGAMEMM